MEEFHNNNFQLVIMLIAKEIQKLSNGYKNSASDE